VTEHEPRQAVVDWLSTWLRLRRLTA
jgi:hypothetical protein